MLPTARTRLSDITVIIFFISDRFSTAKVARGKWERKRLVNEMRILADGVGFGRRTALEAWGLKDSEVGTQLN
jgi:hypothetical protein